MTPDLVELPPDATVADALAEVRRRAEELAARLRDLRRRGWAAQGDGAR